MLKIGRQKRGMFGLLVSYKEIVNPSKAGLFEDTIVKQSVKGMLKVKKC